MSELLALDWDATEVRYVVATATGGRLKIRSVGLRTLQPTEDSLDHSLVGAAIRDELSSQKPRRCKTLVALARNDVEILSLTLPAVKDAELAELVGHSVMRQSPALAEEGIVDFVTISDDPSQPRIVSAAICPAELRNRAFGICESGGITPARLLLRPYALAYWARKADESGHGVSLLVCRAGDDLDLAIVDDGKVTYSRTVRLPSHHEEAAIVAGLTAEIRRTLMVAPKQEGTPRPVERIVLFGNTPRLAALANQLREELSLQATVIDPLGSVASASEAARADSGAFAPLVGMLHDELKGSHAIDFLNPRRPPAPPDRRRQFIMAAAVLATIVAFGGWQVWDSLHELDLKNEELTTRLKELDQKWKKVSRKGSVVKTLDSWDAASVNWLDELRDFSARFPSSRDAVALHLVLSLSRDGGGEIKLNGLVRDPDIVLRMENGIRDDFHQLRIPRVQERELNKNYSWHFDSTVAVKPRTREQYAAHFRGDEPTKKTNSSKESLAKTTSGKDAPNKETLTKAGSKKETPKKDELKKESKLKTVPVATSIPPGSTASATASTPAEKNRKKSGDGS
jgi:Tfp pilus assembly PilM family ATPase